LFIFVFDFPRKSKKYYLYKNTNMKQIYILLIALLMGLSANAEKSGSCGPNLKWHLTDDGVLTITGNGEMDDYYIFSPWRDSDVKRIIIGNRVTTIGQTAFSGCSSLTSVTIPNSVTTIGSEAFSECTNLQKVHIGDSVKAIGEYAFYNCTNITQISSEAVVPPTCESGVFTDINKSKCKLIVPKNSLDAYKQAYQWKDFSLIEGSTTGITNTVYNKAGLADVYTIDGTKRLSKASTDEINALPKGVYIVNGKKIIIK